MHTTMSCTGKPRAYIVGVVTMHRRPHLPGESASLAALVGDEMANMDTTTTMAHKPTVAAPTPFKRAMTASMVLPGLPSHHTTARPMDRAQHKHEHSDGVTIVTPVRITKN